MSFFFFFKLHYVYLYAKLLRMLLYKQLFTKHNLRVSFLTEGQDSLEN